jgi:predicted O-methyltransferase YrrM
VDPALVGPLFESRAQLDGLREELRASGLLDSLAAAQSDFAVKVVGETPRGRPYVFGGNPRRSALGALYAVLRLLRPQTVVETGVCNGVFTSVILLALGRNDAGRLFSIDFPEYEGAAAAGEEIWSGKGGAVVPAGKKPGWLVPDRLRDRWQLTIGRSQDELPPLLDRLETIDFFFHDSEHSYECMSLEFRLAYPRLREGGVLASDDTTWNTAFADFAAALPRPTYPLGESAAMLIK